MDLVQVPTTSVDDARRLALYDEHRKQTWQDIQSSTDNFDKNLLTVSSAALGFSVAFLKDVGKDAAHLSSASWHSILYASWICFAACIVTTVFSFRLSVAALNEQLDYLHQYYQQKNDSFLTKKSAATRTLDVFTWAAAAFFLAGIICTILFCIKNVG
jgi:hypothetical protein